MSDKSEEEISIPVVAEEAHAGTRQIVTGGVRVVKKTVPHEEILQQELQKQKVEVRRVQINRQVDGPQQPREEGTTLIVPVVEEALQVQKIWVLKEEIHITRITEAEMHEERIMLAREEADIERTNASGGVVERAETPNEPSQLSEPVSGNVLRPSSILARDAKIEPQHDEGRSILRRRSDRKT
jgi:stress response protein YsnF